MCNAKLVCGEYAWILNLDCLLSISRNRFTGSLPPIAGEGGEVVKLSEAIRMNGMVL
jgi:hypothetical protein